jgi:hypothetical protein
MCAEGVDILKNFVILFLSVFMEGKMFTRGQIEWAIARVTGQTVGPSGEPRHDLKMRLKRLLDIDRKKGIDAAQPWSEFRRFAFLDGGLPGKGSAISYSQYDAFAVLLGLQLLGGSIPQMAVIRLLRRIRPELKRVHHRILRLSPDRLAHTKGGLERRIQEGLLVEDTREMVFLALPSGAGADLLYKRKQGKIELANIARSPAELTKLIAHLTLISPPVLVFELINPAHQLAYWLESAPLIRRGRP